MAAQKDEGAIVDTSADAGDIGLCGRRRLVQPHALAELVEDGVERHEMGKHVPMEAAAEAVGKETEPASAPAMPARRFVARATSSAKMRSRAVRTSGFIAQRPRQREGQAQDPRPHRRVGEDAVRDASGLVAHATRATARAEAARIAGEKHDDVVAEGVAIAADEGAREVAACEALEGVRHVTRQRRGVGRLDVRDEGGVVLADEAAQDGVRGPTGDIRRGQSEEQALTRGGGTQRASHRTC